MESSASPTSEKPVKVRANGGTLQYIQAVISVAFLLATLYTAWPPAGFLPDSLAEKVSRAIVPYESTLAPNFPTATPRSNLRVGIVSGHWGNDSGAVCSDGLTEAEINQEIATRVKESLIGQGYDVDLLKEFDQRLYGYRAAVLVSIHADSCDYVNDQATGFKVSAAVTSQYQEKAARLTACMRNRYAQSTGLSFHTGSVTSDMTSYHAFSEIHSDTTAAIIETGFMNLDRQILTEHPNLVAQGITDGVLCFLRNEDISPQNTPEP